MNNHIQNQTIGAEINSLQQGASISSEIEVLGNVELGERGEPIRGWIVVRHRATNEIKTGVQVTVHTQTCILGTLNADESRRDVAQELGCDEFCGFSYWPSDDLLRSEYERVHFTVNPENIELPNSPILFGIAQDFGKELILDDINMSSDNNVGSSWPILVAMFSSTYYGRLAGISGASHFELLRHFAETGLLEGLAPGPLFDTRAYLRRAVEAGLPLLRSTESAILHWLRYGLSACIVPTELFDAKFYAAKYPEIEQSVRFGFEHFITTGIHQDLQPNSWFDPAWYSESTPDFTKGSSAFLHFLEYGCEKGHVPSRLLAGIKLQNLTLDDWALRGHGIMSSLSRLQKTASETAINVLLGLYVHEYYCHAARLPTQTSVLEGIGHYLSIGIPRDLSPTPLFDNEFYAKQYHRATGKTLSNTDCSILHWLQHGRDHAIVPTKLFSSQHYRNTYLDMREESIDTFMHFALYGVFENRIPNTWFDPEWFATQNFPPAGKTEPLYINFLVFGAPASLANKLFWQLNNTPSFFKEKTNTDTRVGVSEFAELVDATEARLNQLSADQLRTIFLLFTPENYTGGGALAENTSLLAKFTHFLKHGLETGEEMGPLFSVPYYREQLTTRGLTLGTNESPLLHFITRGIELQISPMPTFDEKAYLKLNTDLRSYPSWLFIHFIKYGLMEGRSFNTKPCIELAADYNDTTTQKSRRLLFVRTAHGGDQPTQSGTIGEAQAKVTSVLDNENFANIMTRAQAIDPAVGDTDMVREILVPPFHDPFWSRLRALQARLRRPHYDHIICVPWLRSGGADLVSGYLTHALSQIFPGESVLFLRTDQPNYDRPDWLAPATEVLDISDIVLQSQSAEAERLLFTLIRGMRPRGVYNVNSRLCWQVMRRYGNRVGKDIKLFSYLFCWDQTPSGVRVGYPTEFYSDTQACLTALLTDTQYLKDELIRTYALPQDIASHIIPVASPTRATIPVIPMAQMGADTVGKRARPLFLWGGRIDRQKRFDLMLEIARRMPYCDFKCWGAAMLDAPLDLDNLPTNVLMMGTFASFTELPLEESDGWVFTSAWEGMPTTIIDLGILGMPIVASAVGGIPELIDETTGWLVDPFDSVDGFVDCLNDMILRPEERVKRATRLQARTASRHHMQTYCETLAPIFCAESA